MRVRRPGSAPIVPPGCKHPTTTKRPPQNSRPRHDTAEALSQLGILTRMLGIHISVAVAWQRASSGDWMTYAADVSRRNEGRKDDDGRETWARDDDTVGRQGFR